MAHPEGLEERVALLESRLEEVSGRLVRAERALSTLGASPRTEAEPERRGPAPKPSRAVQEAATLPGLLGRSLLVLAGAYLIRAVSDAGSIPRLAGIALGLAYAGASAYLAWRAPGRAVLGANAHGLVAVAIAYPLLWESTARFGALTPPAAAALLGGVTAVLLAVGWKRSLSGMLWGTVLAASVVPLALLPSTRAVDLLAGLLVAIGLGVLWMARGAGGRGLSWPPALAADVAVTALAVLAGWPGGPPEAYRHLTPGRAAFVCVALFTGYAATAAFSALARGRAPSPFAMTQSVLALLAGLGGAGHVARAAGSGGVILGLGELALAVFCYGASLRRFHDDASTGFRFLSALGLALALHGAFLVWPPAAVPWAVLGLAAAAAAVRLERPSLALHGAVLVLGAGLTSGLLGTSTRMLLGRTDVARLSGAAVLVLAVALASYLVDALTPSGGKAVSRAISTTLALVTVAGVAAVVIHGSVRLMSAAGLPVERATTACVRTLVVAAGAMFLAYARGKTRRVELAWIAIALLCVGAVKVVLEDFAVGRPATLFPALAAFGIALIVTPALLRRESVAAAPGEEPAVTEPAAVAPRG